MTLEKERGKREERVREESGVIKVKQERKELMFVKYDTESILAQVSEIERVVGKLGDMVRKLHESSAEIKLEKAPAETDA